MKRILPIFLFALPLACYSQVVKCRDASGRISYGQQPCPAGSETLSQPPGGISVIEGGQGQAGSEQYRRQLQEWAAKRDKARRTEQQAEQKESRARRKKWLAEREHCRRLADTQEALRRKLYQGQSAGELQRQKLRLAKVEDQMQDRSCHIYKED